MPLHRKMYHPNVDVPPFEWLAITPDPPFRDPRGLELCPELKGDLGRRKASNHDLFGSDMLGNDIRPVGPAPKPSSAGSQATVSPVTVPSVSPSLPQSPPAASVASVPSASAPSAPAPAASAPSAPMPAATSSVKELLAQVVTLPVRPPPPRVMPVLESSPPAPEASASTWPPALSELLSSEELSTLKLGVMELVSSVANVEQYLAVAVAKAYSLGVCHGHKAQEHKEAELAAALAQVKTLQDALRAERQRRV